MLFRTLALTFALSTSLSLAYGAQAEQPQPKALSTHQAAALLDANLPKITLANAKPPLNQYGSVDVNANVPVAEQVLPKPANFKDPTITPLANQWPDIIPSQPMLNVRSYILMSANTGKILLAYNANKRLPPASLTKLMLLYITQQNLANGSIKLSDKILVPKVAWATGGSRMFLKPGSQVTIQQLIPGIIVDSGNDAAVTLATYIAGTQSAFVDMMNQQAHRLQMTNTHFTDVMGLPAPAHYSSAYDMALLAHAIVHDYPQYLSWFGQKSYRYNGIKQYNFNKLLFIYPDADGLKTGSTASAGFSLVSTAKQPHNPMRLIGVVMGAPSDQASAQDSKALLTYGFRFFKNVLLYPKNTQLEKVRMYFGQNKRLRVGINQALNVTIPAHSGKKLSANLMMNKAIEAPIKKGQVVGTVEVKLGNTLIETTPAVALENNPTGGFWRRLSDHIARWF